MRACLAVVVVLGCASHTPPSAPPPAPRVPAFSLTLTDRGLGPITKNTRVSLTSLRELLAAARLAVTPTYDTSLSFDVTRGDERQFYLVGNDDGSILYLHATSSRIRVRRHASWVVGTRFYDRALLTSCDCWGDTSVCWTAGEHVAVGFARSCEGLDEPGGRRALDGERIARVVWNPVPFTNGGDDEPDMRPSFLPDVP